MPLMNGNLKTLVEKTPNINEWAVAETVLHQMLLALQCIASHKIVHRDIKPENILWEYDANNEYHFCLGDFGLSNDPKLARTVAGTEPFMAPEVYHRQPQSTKVDIWSLFATVVWVRNTQEFRGMCGQLAAPHIHSWLVSIAREEEGYENIRNMAQINPRKRPSAATQLSILNGNFSDPTVYGEVGSGEEEGNELGEQFGSLNLQDNQANYDPANYAQGAVGASTSPEMAYYEPYTSHLREQFPWEGQAGPSNPVYKPPTNAPRVHPDPEVRSLPSRFDMLLACLSLTLILGNSYRVGHMASHSMVSITKDSLLVEGEGVTAVRGPRFRRCGRQGLCRRKTTNSLHTGNLVGENKKENTSIETVSQRSIAPFLVSLRSSSALSSASSIRILGSPQTRDLSSELCLLR